MDLDDLRTDPDAEENGVWVPFDATARVKLARADNPRHRAKMQELLEPWLEVIQNGDLPKGKMEELALAAMAEAIVLDWEGIKDRGTTLEPTLENKLEALKVGDFRKAVEAYSGNIALFRQRKVNGAVKNSPSSSAGRCDTGSASAGSQKSKRKRAAA